MRLQDKCILVTGAGAGIGEQICRRMAKEGGRIAAMDRDGAAAVRVVESLAAGSGPALAFEGDVTSAVDCERAVAKALEALGRIDVLCNVAGVVDGGSLIEASEESWDRSMNINVKGMWRMCTLVVPIMQKQGSGSIVNMGSVAGPFAVKARGVYSVSKAAVIGLTKSLAMDFIGEGIRVNAICPGTVETPSWHQRVNEAEDPAQALKDFIARQPMGRVGKPEEIAALATYLAADESQYLTGQAIMIDGGMTM